MAKIIQNLISLTIILKIMKSFLRNSTHQGISNNMMGAWIFPILVFGCFQFQFQLWFWKKLKLMVEGDNTERPVTRIIWHKKLLRVLSLMYSYLVLLQGFSSLTQNIYRIKNMITPF